MARHGARELPQVRPAHIPPPCRACPKIPDGKPKHWDHAVELEAWEFYALQIVQEARMTGEWPACGWVREWARTVASWEMQGGYDAQFRNTYAAFGTALIQLRGANDGK